MMGYSQISSINNKGSQSEQSKAEVRKDGHAADLNGVVTISLGKETEQMSLMEREEAEQNIDTVSKDDSTRVGSQNQSAITTVKEEQNSETVNEEKQSTSSVAKEEQNASLVAEELVTRDDVSKQSVNTQDKAEPSEVEIVELPLEPPTERKQSQSSTSSGSSAKDSSSPSKVPPPTPPKSSKSPPNQGKMPASKADNIYGDNIDVTQLPGYQSIPDGCPGWKRAMIEKKNAQLLEEARRELLAKKAEEEKWRDVPEWKRNLILEKERKKKEENEPLEAQRRRLQEEENRIQNMPDWKKNLVLKKKD